MYKIVIMNGKPCSGKTTFEELCGIFCTTYLYSTIDPIKEVAKKIGWKCTKDKEDRIFLSELKQISKKYNNFPVEWVKNQIDTTINDYANVGIDIEDKYKKVIFFVDCRETKEIEELKSILPNVVTAVIVRDKNINTDNYADVDNINPNEYDYDYYIPNEDGIGDLKTKAEIFCNLIFEERSK